MKKKTIESKIEKILQNSWCAEDLISLISNIVNEIIGENREPVDLKFNGDPDDPLAKLIMFSVVEGYNEAKREIRQRAKELGIELKKEK